MTDTSSKENNENKRTEDSEKERLIYRLCLSCCFAFYMAAVGYPIGEGGKLFRHTVANPKYYIDVIWSFMMITIVMEWIYWCTKYFDSKELWKKSYYMRIGVVALCLVLAAAFFMEFFDRFYDQITNRSLLRMKRNVFQIPMSFILPLIFTLGTAILSIKDEYDSSLKENERSEEEEDEMTSKELNRSTDNNPLVTVVEGRKIFLKDIGVSLIIHQEGINKIYESHDKHYENNFTLKTLHESLDTFQYRKANRNSVVNRSIIVGYHPNADKGITLDLSEGYTEEIFISKTEVDSFLAWLKRER